MRIVYKRSLTFIGFLIAICLFIGIAYLFYDKVMSNETEVIVDGDLSINYITGIDINEAGTYKFSITNNGDKDISYDIVAKNMKSYNSNLSYNLSSNEASVNLINARFENDDYTFMDNILIRAGVTQNYTLNIKESDLTNFKLNIKINSETIEYFFNTIISNNTPKKDSLTKVGDELAITNEGLIEDVDDYGTTYYFRGKINNNYVSFADKLWRIVRINGDGTVKLVLNDVASELANYNNDLEGFEDFEDTSINSLLLSYYDNYLKDYEDYIANSKYCKEGLASSDDSKKVYNSYSRLVVNKIPTFNCLGGKYKEKIGLLTADEVAYAGANFDDSNKEYYLFNEDIDNIWWTSTLAQGKNSDFYPFSVNENGKIVDTMSGTLYRYLRPSINLIKKITVTGKGTLEEPYILN